MRTGVFDYHRNCSLIHHIPQGVWEDGLPVIVFPWRNQNHAMTPGRTYEFVLQMTREATYVIDGETYRVAHAVGPIEVTGEGEMALTPSSLPSAEEKVLLGDVIDGESADKLVALKRQLEKNAE